MTADLWEEATFDHEGMARQAALARADAAMEDVMPFLLAARSEEEFGHRLAIADSRITSIAMRSELKPDELREIAARRYQLYREAISHTALPEGTDPLSEVMQATHGYGSGAEKPDEHDEGPDYSHGYSEVPQGAPGGPDPRVTAPEVLRPGPVQEATSAKAQGTCKSCGKKKNAAGKCSGCGSKPGKCSCEPVQGQRVTSSLRRQADDEDAAVSYAGRDTGTGSGSVDTGVDPDDATLKAGSLHTAQGGAPYDMTPAGPTTSGSNLPAGVRPGTQMPDGMGPGGMMPPAPAPATPAAGQPNPAQMQASRRDRVAEQVAAVTASVKVSNPGLDDADCRRVARKVVGRYLRTADLADSAVSDDPGTGNGSGGGGGGSMSGFEKYMLGRGLMSKIPSAAADAGELAAL